MFKIKQRWRKFKEWVSVPRRVVKIEGDTLPKKMPKRDLVLLMEGNEKWSIAMKCPCGCGERVELLLIAEAHPRWNLQIDSYGRPTLYPSVWRREGCQSHYFIHAGRVIWT